MKKIYNKFHYNIRNNLLCGLWLCKNMLKTLNCFFIAFFVFECFFSVWNGKTAGKTWNLWLIDSLKEILPFFLRRQLKYVNKLKIINAEAYLISEFYWFSICFWAFMEISTWRLMWWKDWNRNKDEYWTWKTFI